MNIFGRLALICFALLMALVPVAGAAELVNFGKPDNVLELKPALSPYRAPGGGTEADGSSWYIVQVSNDTVRPATRVLLAGQPPRAALSLLPRRTRPAIRACARSTSASVSTLRGNVALGRRQILSANTASHLDQLRESS